MQDPEEFVRYPSAQMAASSQQSQLQAEEDQSVPVALQISLSASLSAAAVPADQGMGQIAQSNEQVRQEHEREESQAAPEQISNKMRRKRARQE